MARDYFKPDSFDKTSAYEFITGRRLKKRLRHTRKQAAPTRSQDSSAEYSDYMHSPEWRAFRLSVFSARGRICQKCLTTNVKMELHHKHYRNFKHELPEDVVILCQKCHAEFHRKTGTGSKRKRR